MSWIERLIIVLHVTGITIGRSAFIAGSMTLITVDGLMCTGQWEIRIVVIKCTISISGWVARKTSGRVINISADAIVLLIRLRIYVAVGTGYYSPHPQRGVTVRTLAPDPFVLSAIDREVLLIVIEAGRNPGFLCVTRSTIR